MRPFEAVIHDARFVPVLREQDPAKAADRGKLLLDGGWPLVEIAATTPDWPEALAALRKTFPDSTIGVGTVLDFGGAKRAADLGASFLVCPHLDRELAAAFPDLLVQGGFTPGEIFAACASGLGKLFPCHVLDPSYLQSLLGVYPGMRVMPTGGLTLAAGIPWLRAGAFAVGVGSSLFLERDPVAALFAASETTLAGK